MAIQIGRLFTTGLSCAREEVWKFYLILLRINGQAIFFFFLDDAKTKSLKLQLVTFAGRFSSQAAKRQQRKKNKTTKNKFPSPIKAL